MELACVASRNSFPFPPSQQPSAGSSPCENIHSWPEPFQFQEQHWLPAAISQLWTYLSSRDSELAVELLEASLEPCRATRGQKLLLRVCCCPSSSSPDNFCTTARL